MLLFPEELKRRSVDPLLRCFVYHSVEYPLYFRHHVPDRRHESGDVQPGEADNVLDAVGGALLDNYRFCILCCVSE